MTYSEARTILRNDILAETSTAFFSDAALLRHLTSSAQELSSLFGFPTAIQVFTVAAGQFSVGLSGDLADLQANEVVFDGIPLQLAPMRLLYEYRNFPGLPRYYNFDVKRTGSPQQLLIAPAPSTGGELAVEYVLTYTPGTADADIWQGRYPQFQELVVNRAAVKAFQSSLELERAAYYQQREQKLMQEFSAFLNKSPLHKLIGEEVAES